MTKHKLFNVSLITLMLAIGFFLPLPGIIGLVVIYFLKEKEQQSLTVSDKKLLFLALGVLIAYYVINIVYQLRFQPVEETSAMFLFIIK